MDAILAAGGTPEPGEPLYEYTQGKPKALLDIHGKPMAQWVLDALNGAASIENIVIVGLDESSGLTSSKIAAYIPSEGGLLENLFAGIKKNLEINPHAEHVLWVSSDIPTINASIVDWVVNKSLETEHDVYYNVIRREVMEARFPASKRSYVKLRDMEVCGGDMNVIRTVTVAGRNELWERIVAARKNPFKQASLIGYDTLIMLMLRLVTLEKAVRMVTSRLRVSGRAVVCPYAEVGMDVDKPNQLDMIRTDLARRQVLASPKGQPGSPQL